MPNFSAISLILTGQSFTTISWTISIVSSSVTVFALPKRGAASMVILPRLNSTTQLASVAYERDDSS